MNPPVEERLRHALADEAEATTVTSEAWERIESRTTGRRRWELARRPLVFVPALAAVLLAVLVVVNVRDADGNRLRVAGAPGRLLLAPTGVDEQFQLTSTDLDPDRGPNGPTSLRPFGRTSSDGVTLDGAATILVSPRGSYPTGAGGSTLSVEGEPVEVVRGPDGNVTLIWAEEGGPEVQDVVVATYGLSDRELVVLAASLRPGPAETARPALPAGFVPLGDHSRAGRPFEGWHHLRQDWSSGNTAGFNVEITESPGRSLEQVAWEQPGARLVTVRGTRGLLSDADRVRLSWLERPGTSVTVGAYGMSESEVRKVAEGLELVSEKQWAEMVSAVEVADRIDVRDKTAVAAGEIEGRAWKAAVVRPTGAPAGDVCLEVDSVGIMSGTCFHHGPGPSAGQLDQLGVSVEGVRAWAFLTGTVGTGVARVEVRRPDGPTITAVPVGHEVGLPFTFLVVPLPPGSRSVTVVALDAEGRESSRGDLEVPALPPAPQPGAPSPPVRAVPRWPGAPDIHVRPATPVPPTSVPG